MTRFGLRAKILLALVGTVGLLLGITVLAIRSQTEEQVRLQVARSLERSREAFRGQEEFRQGLLADFGARLAANNRLPAALDGALMDGSTAYLLQTLQYDLRLAGLDSTALAVVTDVDGAPVAALLAGKAFGDPAAAVPDGLVERVLRTGDRAFGHHLVGDRLYSVHTVVLALFGYPVGTLTLGFPLDDAVARQLGALAGGEVCLVTAGRCIAASEGPERHPALRAELVAAARKGATRRVVWEDEPHALVADTLAADGSVAVSRVIAVPLGGVLAPFERIEEAERVAGVAALLLAVLLGIVLSRGLAGPVRELVGATDRVARGDFDVRVDIRSNDEIGTLAAAFNAMTSELALRERYRGLLDKVVSREIAEELLKDEPRLGGESREVTTLFADVRDFTPMAELLEAHEVVAMLNGFMQRASAAVEAEGGVVDKYVGDEVMALFGAPLARGDDQLRAIRAALRIREAMAEYNRRRAELGQPLVELGMGISTGQAVAGNMGSAERLNYTVVGDCVNVGARLCAEAARGEILIDQATYEKAGDALEARSLGTRELKGISRAVAVWSVFGLRERTPAGAAQTLVAGMLATAVALAAPASPAAAQGLPTLDDLGVGWASEDGRFQVRPRGDLALELYAPGEEAPWLVPETEPFLAPRLRLFVPAFLGSRVFASAELRADRGDAPSDGDMDVRIQQAFLRAVPLRAVPVAVQAGKFVSPFGGWPQRHHGDQDPLVRPPLLYDYRTMVSAAFVPLGAAGFVGWKDVPERFRPIGAPVVWGAAYPMGAMLLGGGGGVTARLAVVNSAPSSEPEFWGLERGPLEHPPSYVAHVAWQPRPELRLGASYDIGPYLQESAEQLRPDQDADAYDQELLGFEAAFARGALQARAELVFDRWEVPNLEEDPRDVSYFLETEVQLTPGLSTAARWNEIRFRPISLDGRDVAWDYDARRLQLGAAYRVSRNTGLRAELAMTSTDSPFDPQDDLLALQAWWRF